MQEASEHITPVMFVVRHSGQTHIHGSGKKEELDGGTEEPGPHHLQSGLNIELQNKSDYQRL